MHYVKSQGKHNCKFFDGVMNNQTLNRHLWLGAGVVFGRNAALGFGPRLGLRWGWLNMPHGWELTLNPGLAWQPPVPKGGDRVRPLIDIDLRGGIDIRRNRSLVEADNPVHPIFGMTLGLGLTF